MYFINLLIDCIRPCTTLQDSEFSLLSSIKLKTLSVPTVVSDKAPPSSDVTVQVPSSPTVLWESRASRPDYSTDQWRTLRGAFDQSAYCSRLDRQRLVHSLDLSPADVQVHVASIPDILIFVFKYCNDP